MLSTLRRWCVPIVGWLLVVLVLTSDAAVDVILSGGGTLPIDISGTPAAPQEAQWVDENTLKGVPRLYVDARDYGAVCNGVTDDTAALQAAIDAMTTGMRLVFPKGTCVVSATLEFGSKKIHVSGASNNTSGTRIIGSVNGPLLKLAPGSGSDLGVVLEYLNVDNTHATGIAIQYENFTVGTVRNTQVKAFVGIRAAENMFTLLLDNVKFTGMPGNPPGSIGLLTGGHTQILASDFSGWDEAVRASGATVNMMGCRLEVNHTALVLGKDAANTTVSLGRSFIGGNSFEANGTAIKVYSLYNSTLSGMTVAGTIGAPDGESHYGLDLGSMSDVTVQAVGASGRFDGAAIRVTGTQTRVLFGQVATSNAIAGAKEWDVRSPLSQLLFEQTNFDPRGDGVQPLGLHDRVIVRGLVGMTHLEPLAIGKNVRGKNVVVPSAATTLAIAFQPSRTSGNAAINVAAATDGAGTLPEGTYYYIATLVTEAGETSATAEKTVVVTAPNDTVDVSFFTPPGAAGWKRRVYRGTATGVYDGYFETALNATTFTDTNAAFTGVKSPPAGGGDGETSMQEPDANYAVLVTPAWETSVWVTDKATTGFTIHFGTGPSGDSTLDWFMVR